QPPCAVGGGHLLVWETVTVHPHHWAERAQLEPTHQQFTKIRVRPVTVMESADIGGEPRNTGNAHVDPGGDLPGHVLEGGRDVPGPGERSEALTAGPRAADEVDGLGLARRMLPLEDSACECLWVE